MSILSSADFQVVRANLDTSVTSNVITDAQIAMPTFQGRAEQWISDSLTPVDPSTLSGSNQLHTKNAAIYYLAALLCPIVPQYTSLTADGTLAATRKAFDAAGRQMALFDEAETEIALVQTALNLHPTDLPVTIPTQFRIGRGTRGRRFPAPVVLPPPVEYGLP